MTTFKEELKSLINRHSRENESNTPDFLLGQFIEGCLAAFEQTVNAREKWYGRPSAAPAINGPGENLGKSANPGVEPSPQGYASSCTLP